MLIEDDPFFRKFYSLKLTESRFAVVAASDGGEGLVKAKIQNINVILLDLIMPRVDGFTFLEKRKQDPALAAIPVIVFSTLGQEQDVTRARELGASDYVNKSFLDFENLLTKITSVMKS